MFGWGSKRAAKAAAKAPPQAVADDAPKPSKVLPPMLAAIKHNREQNPVVVLPAVVAADRLVAFIQTEIGDGWFLPEEIDQAWKWYSKEYTIAYIPVEVMREMIGQHRRVSNGRYRLLGDPQFAEVRRRLQKLGKKDDRAHVYHIKALPSELLAEIDAPAEVHAAPTPPPGAIREARTPGEKHGQNGGRKAGKSTGKSSKHGHSMTAPTYAEPYREAA